MSVWDRDFNKIYAEYHGAPLKTRTCNHCGRELLLEEKAKRHYELGRICVDCADYLCEEESVWEQ